MEHNLALSSPGPILGLIAKSQKITQGEIAKQCLVSRISINRFFQGHTEVRATDFITICSVLGINISEMMKQKLISSAGTPT